MEKELITIEIKASNRKGISIYKDIYQFEVEATRDEVSKKLREIADDIDTSFKQ